MEMCSQGTAVQDPRLGYLVHLGHCAVACFPEALGQKCCDLIQGIALNNPE